MQIQRNLSLFINFINIDTRLNTYLTDTKMQARFYLFQHVCPNNWIEFIFSLLGKDKEKQLKLWKRFMKLESTKLLPLLIVNDLEFGLGDYNKVVMFDIDNVSSIATPNPIVIEFSEGWTIPEVRDVEQAFNELLNKWNVGQVESMIVLS